LTCELRLPFLPEGSQTLRIVRRYDQHRLPLSPLYLGDSDELILKLPEAAIFAANKVRHDAIAYMRDSQDLA
jgi:hypothetical protein